MRELQNVIERALVMSDGSSLTVNLSRGPTGPLRNADDRAPSERSTSESSETSEELSLEDYFQRFVLEHQDSMNETELAQKLGISRKCLWERRQRFGIPRNRRRTA